MDWKYEYLVEQIHRTSYKRHENFVIGSLIHDPDLSNLKPCTQYYVRRNDKNYALIDLYYPQIDLAIEVDEPHHENNIQSDRDRESDVSKNLSCEFVRISISSGNVMNQINSLKKRIFEKQSDYISNNKFESWNKPEVIDIEDAKNQFKNTLFVKIKGEIPPNDLYSRQTGHWRIDKNKKDKLKKVIVVHNSVITRIFENLKWYTSTAEPNKVGYNGTEVTKDKIVGTKIENWTWQQTITYSNDMY